MFRVRFLLCMLLNRRTEERKIERGLDDEEETKGREKKEYQTIP